MQARTVTDRLPPSHDDVYPGRPAGRHIPLSSYTRYQESEMRDRAVAMYEELARRRTVRQFSTEPVPRALIEYAIRSAGTAPSGAHMQPWHFVVIGDAELKARIRDAAEAEEYETYRRRMSDEWRSALAPIGTDWVKPHLTDAPWVVVLFKQSYGLLPDGSKQKHYYVDESVGIAAGLFITAIHHMGLATLTHTPTPTAFLRALLDRGKNETAVLVLPIGYPHPDATVPDFSRKSLEEITTWYP
jgi:iodotyrosine deiodinase